MRTLMALLVSTMVLAGCFGDDGTDTQDPPTTDTTDWEFRLSDTGFRGPEPTIAVARDGTLFFHAIAGGELYPGMVPDPGLATGPALLRSRDHGVSWQNINPVYSAPITNDPYVYMDPATERLFMIQLSLPDCSYIAWSDDLGDTWSGFRPLVCGLPSNDHQKLVAAPAPAGFALAPLAGQVYPNVLYYANNGFYAGSVAISLDGGLTWTEPNVLDQETAADNSCVAGLHGDPVVDSHGALFVPHRGSCRQPDGENFTGPYVARSLDGAFSFDYTDVDAAVGTQYHDKNPAMAVDADDHVAIWWPREDNRLAFSASMDQGATWSDAVVVSDVNLTTMPAAQGGDAGRFAVAYYGSRDTDQPPDLAPDTAKWYVFLTFTEDAFADAPVWTTVRVTPDPIQIGAISTNTGDAPAGSRNLLDFIDLEVDVNGRIFIAYADGCTGACDADPDQATPDMSRSAVGKVAIEELGPGVFAATTLERLVAA